MKKILLSLITSTLVSTAVYADIIGLEAGAAYWNTSVSGDITYKGENVGLDKDLGLDSDITSNYYWAIVEHPIPIIPNIKIEQTNFSSKGNASSNINFYGNNYNSNEKTDLVLDQTDLKLYYELLDNWVNIDAGFNIKRLDGHLKVGNDIENIDAIIPMLYLKAKLDIPFTGFSLESDLNYASYSGSKVYDFKAGAVYETDIGLGATLGYKKQKLVLDDIDDFDADMTIDGLYLGVFYHF